MKRKDFCHVYGPTQWHDDAYLVGNREALVKVKEAIDQALEFSKGSCNLCVNDGEAFDLRIVMVNNPETQDKLVTPYTNETVAPVANLWPAELYYQIKKRISK